MGEEGGVLQIASGKFFGEGERWEFEAKGILYSNMSWVAAVETRAGTLEPVGVGSSEGNSYVLTYRNRMEKRADSIAVVRAGDEEIVEQFGWLCMIWFAAFFDGDKQNVLVNCRERPAQSGDRHAGSKFARLFLSPERRITEGEADGFARFVDKAVGLPRRDYRALVGFLRTVSHALHVLRQNLDLAYSMLVYALESLGQAHEHLPPRWEDYDEAARGRLDPILEALEPETSGALRGALLEGAHLKTQRRFVEFALSHVPDEFFVEGAEGIARPARLSEMEPALKNAYRARSQYVHVLGPLMHQLKSPGIGEAEVFVWKNKPYLTFNGLLRVARAVALEFVERRPYLETEEYDWEPELPGLLTLMPAGQYWIWQHEGFSPVRSADWLSAFLQVWLETVTRKPTDEPVMPHLGELLARFEALLGSASTEQKRRMLTIHALYNHYVSPTTPNHEAVWQANESLFVECSIESMVLLLLTGREFPWDAGECAEAYGVYSKEKLRKGGLSLPPAVEVAIMSLVADLHRDAGDAEVFAIWSRLARLESAGRPIWQGHIGEVEAGEAKLDLNVFFASSDEAAPGEPTDTEPAEIGEEVSGSG